MHDHSLSDHQLSPELSPQCTEYLDVYKHFDIDQAPEGEKKYLLERYPLSASIEDAAPCELNANVFIPGDICLPNILHDARTPPILTGVKQVLGMLPLIYIGLSAPWRISYARKSTRIYFGDRMDKEKIVWISWLSEN